MANTLIVLCCLVLACGQILFTRRQQRLLERVAQSGDLATHLQHTLDLLPDGLVVLDSQDRILEQNATFARLFAARGKSLLGTKLSELGWQTLDARARGEMPWFAVLAGSEASACGQVSLEISPDNVQLFSVHATRLHSHSRRTNSVVVTFTGRLEDGGADEHIRHTLQTMQAMQRDLTRQNQELQVLATRDALTNILNRRALFDAFDNLYAEVHDRGRHLSCVMVDIDKFKSINDRYGHGTGDRVIKLVAGVLSETARATDLVGRYGGEEFCVLLPDTELGDALLLGERIRNAIQRGPSGKFMTPIQITASLGISSTADGAATPQELCNQADRALYVAKESGRNRVVSWREAVEYAGQHMTASVPQATSSSTTAHLSSGSWPRYQVVREQALLERIEQLEKALDDSERSRTGSLSNGLASPPTVWSLLQERVTQALLRAERHSHRVAVVAILIENFETVNAAFGNDCGQTLLQAINERLRENLRAIDTVSLLQHQEPGIVLVRLRHDEFVLVLTDLKDDDDIRSIAERIIETMRDPFLIGDIEVFAAPSLGIAVSPNDGQSAATLVTHANAALRHSRQRGSAYPCHFYSRELNARALESIQIESELRRAVERREFVLHYQPRIDARTCAISGMEALIRWNHPQQGLVFPDKFIPLAEKIGLIDQIGLWVVEEVCRQFKIWRADGIDSLEIAVNVSPVQLRDEQFPHTLKALVDAAGVAPSHIELEITESVVIGNLDKVATMLNTLAGLGFKAALDDFGTGYSSLSYLRNLPVHRLKIDRAFLADLGNSTDFSIVSAVIELAHSLSMKVVAEGVETDPQWEALRALGCDEVQGYLWSRPVSAADAGAMLGKGSPLRRRLQLVDDPAFGRMANASASA